MTLHGKWIKKRENYKRNNPLAGVSGGIVSVVNKPNHPHESIAIVL